MASNSRISHDRGNPALSDNSRGNPALSDNSFQGRQVSVSSEILLENGLLLVGRFGLICYVMLSFQKMSVTPTFSFDLEGMEELEGAEEAGLHDVTWGAFEVLIAITISVMILGSLGLFLLVLTKRELRQTYTNWFILSALVPILIAGICIEPYLLKLLLTSFGGWTAGLVGCHLSILGDVLVSLAVPSTLLAISIDRCIYVWNPARYTTLMRPLVAGLLIFVTWLVPIIVTFAMAYGYGKPELIVLPDNMGHVCISNESHDIILYAVVLLGIPALFNLIVLIAVVCRYCLLRRSLTDKTSQTEARNALLLVVIPFVAFLLLNTPTYIPYTGQHIFLQWKIARFLKLAYEAMEAFIFMVLLADVRGTISSLCCRSCRSSDDEETVRLVKPM